MKQKVIVNVYIDFVSSFSQVLEAVHRYQQAVPSGTQTDSGTEV